MPSASRTHARRSRLAPTTVEQADGMDDRHLRHPHRALRDYRTYGLWVRSPIALPFTPVPIPPAGGPDVIIRIGSVPETLPAFADRHSR